MRTQLARNLRHVQGWALLGSFVCLMLFPGMALAVKGQKTWTDTPDWASASSFQSVTWKDVPGQIQLIKNPPRHYSTPYIYIPNSTSNTITQLSTKTGQKNWTISLDSIAKNSDPSRTTVDPNGDVWVGMRNTDKVAWISQTGKIKKVVRTGKKPRAISIDHDGNVWVGNYDAKTLVKLDGRTGATLVSIKMDCPYGAAVDINNNVWVINRCNGYPLVKVSSQGKVLGRWYADQGYGIATDALGQVWVANYKGGCVFRFSNSGQNLGCVRLGNGCANPRGIAVDGNGNAWVACSNAPVIVKVSSTGQVVGFNNQVGQHCVGMAVDVDGHVWAVARSDSTASKVNATTNKLVGKYPTHGAGPYTYSDMTGFQYQISSKAAKGHWRAIHQTPCLANWTAVKWNGQTPPKTHIEVRARSAPTKAALATAAWSAPLTNGQKPPIPKNHWIEVEVTLRTLDAAITPFVTDVTVEYDGGGKEICNGKDDDCDGIIDNIPGTRNPITRTCKTRCGTGIAACTKGDWENCTARYPSIEVCNGIDDDCDGEVDEGAGGSCPGGSLCVGGTCLKSCKQECPARSLCQDVNGQKVCVGNTPCSQLDAQCKAQGKVCKNGRCMGKCEGIICPDGFFCNEGHCEKDDCYNAKRPCPPEQICRAGKCVPHPCPKGTCPAGQACKNGQCIPSCKGVSCNKGNSCREGKCVPDPCANVSCDAGKACVAGQCTEDPCATAACRSGQACVAGNCIDHPCAGVRCPDGQVCRLPNGDCFDPNPGQGTNPQPGTDGGTTNPPPDDGGGGLPPGIPRDDAGNPIWPAPPGDDAGGGTTNPPVDPRCPNGGTWVNGNCQTTGNPPGTTPPGGRRPPGGCLCTAGSLRTNGAPLFFLAVFLFFFSLTVRRQKPRS